MSKPESPSLAQPDPIDHRGMVELVTDDRIIGTEQRFKQSTIRIVTGRVQDCIVGLQEAADLRL